MLYALFGYAAFCVGFAYLNAVWIRKDKRIYHGINGALHLIIIAALGYFFSPFLIVALLFQGRLVFDIALNKFRGLEFDYVPENPKSVLDRIEKKVFDGDGIFPKVVYANGYAISLILLISMETL